MKQVLAVVWCRVFNATTAQGPLQNPGAYLILVPEQTTTFGQAGKRQLLVSRGGLNCVRVALTVCNMQKTKL